MNKIFIFTFGSILGGLITWKFVEEKYKKISDEEIQSVKDKFKEREKERENYKVSDNTENNYGAYKNIIKDLSYKNNKDTEEFNNDDSIKHTEDGKEIDISKPYLISPEEYGELDEFDTKSWTLYADDILVDDFDQIIEDPKLFIGDALKHFGEYEDDSVFIRNTELRTDYEILKVTEEFSKLY